jgi:hypothetical protein
LTKFPEKVVFFGTRFSSALHFDLLLVVFFSYKDVNHVAADFLGYRVRLLDRGALYNTPDVDLQVSLLTDFVNHLYGICVPGSRSELC